MSEQARVPFYKILISGTLIQLTAFSTGGHDPHGRVDSPVARDGQDRLTLRGSGIAGAFIATAEHLLGSDLPRTITAGAPSVQLAERARDRDTERLRLHESVWRFYTSHPEKEPELEVRAGVGIRQDTGAAAENLKYEVETVPPGTRWPFLLEIDDYRDDPEGKALPIALHTLEAWKELCVLGRSVARGLGWMRLNPDSLKVLALDAEDADRWPDAWLTPQAAFSNLLDDAAGDRLMDDACLARIRDRISLYGFRPFHGTGTVRIEAPAEEGAWGLDTLSLGASEAMRPLQQTALRSLAESHPEEFDPDLTLAWTQAKDRPPRPFLPGSGLRGPLRHALSWWQRSRCGETVHDPNTPVGRGKLARKPKSRLDPLERLFGSGPFAGALLMSDAELIDSETFGDDAILFLEQHAEDELTGGTYAAAKFNRLALLRGAFRFHYRIEADSEQHLRQLRPLLALLGSLGDERRIPIGGANWRGHGWVRWSIDLPPGSPDPDAKQSATAEVAEHTEETPA